MITIVVSGPQATGKTTLALALGKALAAPVFSRDPIMTVLYGGGLRRWRDRGWVPATGLEIQTVLLARQLELDQPAVLECVAPQVVRQRWRAMTLDAGHRHVSVECVCSDPVVHRARFDQRLGGARRRAAGWDRVIATMENYRRDEHAAYVADAVRPIADLVTEIIDLANTGPSS